jgi:DNA-binding NtrC family response regulator
MAESFGDDIPTFDALGRAAPSRPGTLQLLVFGEGIYATHPLPARGEVLIGRGAGAQVHVDDGSISRRHAMLRLGPPLTIEDLDSANGTRVARRRIVPGERVEVAPGDVIDLGSVMVVVQSGASPQRPRRIWPHGYFLARLEEECARATRPGATGAFAVAHLRVQGIGATRAPALLLGGLRATDVIAAYAPDEYELLIGEVDPPRAQEVLRTLITGLGGEAATAQAGIAFYPADGRTPDELIARSGDELHGPSRADPAGPLFVGEMTRGLLRLVDRVAQGDISVLVLGETGVGKEILAQTIHERSPRSKRPIVCVNCATLSEALLESELFGHERGAFTGAVRDKPGRLETAHGGTVFLDEIGEMPTSLQSKLLRVLEDRQVTRVGALKARQIDVRFIAATNRDLPAEIARGRFRQDLYFRLNGVSLVVPPLRERVSEIAPLARRFIAEASGRAHKRPVPSLSQGALRLLEGYAWPGNIRELRNVVERAVLLCSGGRVTEAHLPTELLSATFAPGQPSSLDRAESPEATEGAGALWGAVDQLERRRVCEALDRCGGNQTRAAKLLGISRPTLIARMEAYDLPRPRRRTKR